MLQLNQRRSFAFTLAFRAVAFVATVAFLAQVGLAIASISA